MTQEQKKKISEFRNKGLGYSAVAKITGLSKDCVKAYCRRNGLAGVRSGAVDAEVCEFCGKPLTHTPGKKKRRFCSDGCRRSWWAEHPEAVNRKAVYGFTCPVCGEDFTAYGNNHRKYCSRKCYASARGGEALG